MIFDKHLKLKLVRVSIEVNLILTCRSCSKFWSTSLGYDIYIHYAYLWYIYIYIYDDDVCLLHLSLYVLFLFSLYTYASYLLYAIFYLCFTLRCFDEFCLKCFKNTGCQSLSCHELSSCKVFQEFVLG